MSGSEGWVYQGRQEHGWFGHGTKGGLPPDAEDDGSGGDGDVTGGGDDGDAAASAAARLARNLAAGLGISPRIIKDREAEMLPALATLAAYRALPRGEQQQVLLRFEREFGRSNPEFVQAARLALADMNVNPGWPPQSISNAELLK